MYCQSSPLQFDITLLLNFLSRPQSGDPLPDAVIIWTRYTPTTAEESIALELRLAPIEAGLPVEDHLDPSKNPNLRRIQVTVSSSTDFIAKLDITGLPSNAKFVYGFSDGSVVSEIGQTRTAPGPGDEVESLTYAVFSCSHYANGYFHAYDVASTIEDLDLWLHVGDYVYEHGFFSPYASDSPKRKEQILPKWEQISLQDYRNRMATYHTDEGLRNLRRRAPLVACWDDHDITNNPWGQGTPESSGAENHQAVCEANVTSPPEDKVKAKCDRDEGDIVARFNAAAQSYMEWLPIRRYEGKMGVVEIGAINQVISWGDMATFVTFDTRISHRSKDPTLNSGTTSLFLEFASTNMDVSQYSNESSPVYAKLQQVASGVQKLLENPELTMIGDDLNYLQEAFSESKKKGQTWQIWATATALGRAVKGNTNELSALVPDETQAQQVKAFTNALLVNEKAAFFRALVAESLTHTPWNRDDFSGFASEQRKILAMMKENSNNPIVLAGDLHDGYAWQLYEGGETEGTPTAVNLVCPGVTAPVRFVSPRLC